MSRFLASILENGMIVPKEPLRVSRYAGKEAWIEIHDQPTQGIRSDAARNYQWGVVYRRIAEETGNDPDSIHYALKREAVRVGLLPPEYILMGSSLLEAEPTTKQESEIFWRYIGWIREGAETGSLFGMRFHIPEPNEWEDVSSGLPDGPVAEQAQEEHASGNGVTVAAPGVRDGFLGARGVTGGLE